MIVRVLLRAEVQERQDPRGSDVRGGQARLGQRRHVERRRAHEARLVLAQVPVARLELEETACESDASTPYYCAISNQRQRSKKKDQVAQQQYLTGGTLAGTRAPACAAGRTGTSRD